MKKTLGTKILWGQNSLGTTNILWERNILCERVNSLWERWGKFFGANSLEEKAKPFNRYFYILWKPSLRAKPKETKQTSNSLPTNKNARTNGKGGERNWAGTKPDAMIPNNR